MRTLRLMALLLLMTAPVAARAQDIVLAADQWCPYNCAPDDDHPGFAIEVAKAIYEPLGYTVRYKVMPWSRAVEAARNGDVAAVIGATEAETPFLTFPKQTLAVSQDGFYVRKNSDWSYNGPDSLNDVTLGVIEDYGYDEAINAYIARHHNDMKRVQPVAGNNALVQNIEKLRAERIDAVIEDTNVFRYTLMHWNDARDEIKEAGSNKPTPMYIAFSPKLRNSAEMVRIFDAGMARLRQSGQIQVLMTAYGIRDPKGQ